MKNVENFNSREISAFLVFSEWHPCKMQETRNNCFGSEKPSISIRQPKTEKHECRNITATYSFQKQKRELSLDEGLTLLLIWALHGTTNKFLIKFRRL